MPDFLQRSLIGKRLLIFDFDGTIADTSSMHARAFAEVLHPFAVPVDYPAIAGRSTTDAMALCFEKAGIVRPDDETMAELSLAQQERVLAMIRKDINTLPGVDRFLRWAKGHYWMAIATSGSRGTVSLALERLGYTNWFSSLITADEVTRAKPDPEAFLAALSATGFAATDALIFEDSEAGFAAAKAARIDCVDAGLLGFLTTAEDKQWA